MDLILSKLYVLLANIIEFFTGDFHIVLNFTERGREQRPKIIPNLYGLFGEPQPTRRLLNAFVLP
jgi:hypothetical protein